MHIGGAAAGWPSRHCQWNVSLARPLFSLSNVKHGWPRPDKMAAFSASPVNSCRPRPLHWLSSTSYLRRLFAPAQFRQIETAPRHGVRVCGARKEVTSKPYRMEYVIRCFSQGGPSKFGHSQRFSNLQAKRTR